MKAMKDIVGVFSTTIGAIFAFVLMVVIGIYIAADRGLYIHGILAFFPRRMHPGALELMNRIGHALRWWMLGQSLSMLVLSSTVTIGLWGIGIPNAVVLGLFTAVMTFIPNLGPLIAFIPIALTALTQSPFKLVSVLIFYAIIQSLEGFFITPMIHRRVITLAPVLILVAQILLLQLAGFLGVLLAMPLITVAMVTVRTIYIEGFLAKQTNESERPSRNGHPEKH